MTLPLSDHSVLVTIHDQELLIRYRESGKFAGITSPLRFMFVGKGPVDRVENEADVTIARRLPDNIEDHKFLVDFTSWYAAIANNLLSSRFVSLIQYDVNVSEDFCARSLAAMQDNPDGLLGYCPVEMRNRNFIRDNMGYRPLRDAIRKVYGFDIKVTLRQFARARLDPLWPATNNLCIGREALADFVRWFTPVAMEMGNTKPAGHAFERAIKVYAILSGRRIRYDESLLQHFQLNSHGTQDMVRTSEDVNKLFGKP